MNTQTHIRAELQITPDEEVVHIARKHVFILVKEMVGVILFATIPFVLLVLFGGFIYDVALVGVSVCVWLLVVWMFLFTIWTNYYLDVWVVTNKRILDIDQITLFRRRVSTLGMKSVQDIRVEKDGILQDLFNYGDLYVQSAGSEKRFLLIEGVRHPNDVRNIILHEVDKTLGIVSPREQF